MVARLAILTVLLAFMAGLVAHAQQDAPAAKPSLADKTLAETRRADERNLAEFKNNPDMLVLPGLLADRKAKTVRIAARATGISSKEPLEFLMVPDGSGKEYEALAASFAKAADVKSAIEFIGLPPGRPVNYRANQYWPKGERVTATFEWDSTQANGGKPVHQRIRAEDLVKDLRTARLIDRPGLPPEPDPATAKSIPRSGFVFTGSYKFKTEEGKEVFAAEALDSRSILAIYNEPACILDIPWQWGQSSVYGALKASADHHFETGQALTIVLEPMNRDGVSRVVDLRLRVLRGDDKPGLAGLRFTLLAADEKPLIIALPMVNLLAEFGKLTESGRDAFVSIEIDSALSLGQVRQFFKVVQSLDNADGVRVDAPPAGHLFYRAFFPPPELRKRDKRLGRPWELHLESADGKAAGELILPADDIDDNNGKGDLKFPANTPEELAKTLAEKSDRWSQSVYIFAPDDLTYGAMMRLVGPSMKTHPTIYVFQP